MARQLVLETSSQNTPRRGHEVFTPTLTGLADRVHLLSPQVDLETHITDVANLIRWEELADVVLCGHDVMLDQPEELAEELLASSISWGLRHGNRQTRQTWVGGLNSSAWDIDLRR